MKSPSPLALTLLALLVGLAMPLVVLQITLASPIYSAHEYSSVILESFQQMLSTWISVAEEMIRWILTNILNLLARIGRLIYVTLGVSGFTLWSTGLSRYTGRRLLIGALMLALFLEVFVRNLPELA